MPTFESVSDRREGGSYLESGLLALVLCVGFSLRFYRLDIPSMWYDEILLPQTLTYPLRYFLEWLTTLEVHPPYPYLLVRLAMLAGPSDGMLRLPFALAGVAGIYVLYVLGRDLFSRRIGLLCAVLLAINPLDVYVSRVVRPYSFVILFAAASLYFLLRVIDSQRRVFVILLAASHALMLMFHYDAVFAMATTLAVLLWFAVLGRSTAALRSALLFCAFFALFSLPTFYFLLQAIAIRAQGAGLGTVAGIFQQFFIKSLPGLLDFYPYQNAFKWLNLVLLLPGLFLAIRDRRLSPIVLCTVFVPFVSLLILRHGYSLSTWHISYMLPAAVLVMALGADALCLGKRGVVACSVLGLTAFGVHAYATTLYESIYNETSNSGLYKTAAKMIPEWVRPGEAALLDPMFYHGTNWYLEQYTVQNPLYAQHGENGQDVVLNVFSEGESPIGHLYKNRDEIVQALGAPQVERTYLGGHAYKFLLRRAPAPVIDGPTFQAVLGALPQDFYPHVRSFRDVFVYPYWGGLITPTVNRQWCGFEYEIDNRQQGAQKIEAAIRAVNEGKGNQFLVSAQFDEEPPVPVLDGGEAVPLKKEGNVSEYRWRINRYRPFSTLRLRFSMWADLQTPGYNGGNLDKVGFQRLTVTAKPLTHDFFKPEALPFGTSTENLQDMLSQAEPPRQWRWALGPRTAVTINLPRDGEVVLRFAFNNPLERQTVTLSADGRTLWTGEALPAQKWMRDVVEQTVRFKGKKGANTLVFQFSRWNGSPDFFSQTDHTPYAVAFVRLDYDMEQ
jgi:hypothetical protein